MQDERRKGPSSPLRLKGLREPMLELLFCFQKQESDSIVRFGVAWATSVHGTRDASAASSERALLAQSVERQTLRQDAIIVTGDLKVGGSTPPWG